MTGCGMTLTRPYKNINYSVGKSLAAYEKIRRGGPVRAEAHKDLQQAAEAGGAQDFFIKRTLSEG